MKAIPLPQRRLRPVSLPAESHVVQLTGRYLKLNQTEFTHGEIADPSAPHVTADGKINIYGSGNYFLQYADWDALNSGKAARRVPLSLYHPGGRQIAGVQRSWDINVHEWEKEAILYAGVMVPLSPKKRAKWPDDNWTRRVHAFRKDTAGRWIREAHPLFGEPAKEGWIGHCYGHHFLTEPNGDVYVFYERVTEEAWTKDNRRLPFVTEIFARRMETPTRAADDEIPILNVGNPPYPATYRRDCVSGAPAGYLIEGPRPVRMEIEGKPFYVFGFSSGDFPTDGYGINVAWSRQPLGPYQPILAGADLLDLGKEIRETLRLSWGPGRPIFFQDEKKRWRLMFHAVRKDILPNRDYSSWPKEPLGHFYRSLFLAYLEVSLNEAGEPRLRIP